MESKMQQSIEKVRTLTKHILAQCEKEGLTVNEARLLPVELRRQIEESIEKRFESEVFLK